MLHREIPFLRIVLPLCAGIITGLYSDPGKSGCFILLIISLSLIAASVFYNKRITNYLYGAGLFLTMYSTGLTLFTRERGSLSGLKEESAIFSSVLTDYAVDKENSIMLNVKLDRLICEDSIIPVKGSMVIYLRKDSVKYSFKPGDSLTFRCTPLPIVNKGNPYEFNYSLFMESRGFRYYSFTGKKDIIRYSSPKKRSLRYNALIIRNRIISMYERRGITDENLALVSAITLGEKDHLDPEQKQNFIKAGVMHIMAVSGLHAVILSWFVFNLLFFLKRRFNILRVLITITFLIFFAFITGLTPSVVRATIMFSFLQAGTLLKRPVNGINSVLASAFILILIRPSVIFDAGFLLSYAAVIFIIGFYRGLYQLINFRNRIADIVWQSVAVTLAAQAGTLSLTIMLFNRFPTYFILTNLIIVPLSSLLIVVACVVPLTFPLVPVSEALAYILEKLTELTEWITAHSAALPHSTIDSIGLTVPECVLLTISISLLFYFFLIRPGINIKYPLTALFLFVSLLAVKHFTVRSHDELVVYNTPGYSTIGIKTGKQMDLFTNNPLMPPEVTRHCSVLGIRIQKHEMSNLPFIVETAGTRFLIADSLKRNIRQEDLPGILIFTGKKPFADDSVKQLISSNHRLITTESTPYYSSLLLPGRNKPEMIWQVRISGAYRLNIRK